MSKLTKKELIAENTELKENHKKFEKGFIELQEQLGEMQLYTHKLISVYKLLVGGEYTKEEKLELSENFDSISTREEIDNLYKEYLNDKFKIKKEG